MMVMPLGETCRKNAVLGKFHKIRLNVFLTTSAESGVHRTEDNSPISRRCNYSAKYISPLFFIQRYLIL
jgi:hypothetical protein